MTPIISSPTALQTVTAGAALRSALQPTVDALSDQFNRTLSKALDSAVQQSQTADQATASTTQQPTPQAAATSSAATGTAAGAAWQAPWLKGADTASQYLHKADADTAARQQGKPDIAQFKQATGCDFATASSLLYGVVGSNDDFRDWNAIMASADPVLAARQATGALYNSDLPYSDSDSFKPDSKQTIAAAGNFAWLKVEGREGLWLMNSQGGALRQVHFSAPEVLRASREFGLNPADLSSLADQMDAQGVKYAPGELYPGSDHGVDLRNLAQGGMGAAYDWTSDPLAHLKGPGAQDAVAADALMAREMGLQRTPASLGAMPQAAVSASPQPTTATAAAAIAGGVQASAAVTAAPTPTSSAASMDALGRQLTENLLAQLQSALQNWQSAQAQGSGSVL